MTRPHRRRTPAHTGSLVALTTLFFLWGFITCLNDILIPHLKAIFTLNYAEVMLVQFCFFTAYFVVSVPSGFLVEKIGYKGGIITGLGIAGCACLLFYPAAALRDYPLFLLALFILATGITLLQVSANPYVTVLGAAETASSRLTLTQAFNSLGTTLAPYFGSLFILGAATESAAEVAAMNAEQLAGYQAAQAAAVQQPYLALAAALFLVAAVFALLRLPAMKVVPCSGGKHKEAQNAWQFPHLVLGAVAIFVYVGAEVSIGSFLVNFLGLPEIADLAERDAGRYVSLYWGGAMVGRFAGALVMRRVRPAKVLSLHALLAVVLLLLTMVSSGRVAMVGILAVGLCNSIMFPTIFSLALTGLGPHAGQGSGILCAAIVGGAVLPLIQGLFADWIGLQPAFFLPTIGYLYIAFYGWRCGVMLKT